MSSFITNSRSIPPSSPPAPEPTLYAEILTSASDLEALRPAWENLYAGDPHATPFQSPAWLLPWMRQMMEGELLSVAIFTPKNHLAGLFPGYIYRDGKTGARHLFPLGIATSDYLGPLFDARFARAGARVLMEAIREQADRFDVAELPQLSGDSALRAVAPQEVVTEAEPCRQLTLRSAMGVEGGSCIPSEMPQLPLRISQNLRYYHRRAMRRGLLHCAAATAENAERAFDQLLAFHAERWHARDEASVLDDLRVQAMHRAALPQLAANGTLQFLTLSLNDCPLATLYGLVDPPRDEGNPRRRFYYYLAGFDAAHRDLSPGTLLLAHALLYASQLGCGVFDFLRGDEAYKELWGAKAVETYKITLGRGSGKDGDIRPGMV